MPANILTAQHARNARPGHNPTLKAGEAQPDPSKPFKMADGKGLWLEVRPSGHKVWRYRYRIGKDEQTYTIGEYGDGKDQFSLEAAREARAEARKLVKEGTHPKDERASRRSANIQAGKDTFRALAGEWIEENRPHWSAHYTKQVQRGMEQDIYPVVGELPVKQVNSAHVRTILARKKGKATTQILLRQWAGAVFRFAIAHERADTDPTFATRRTIKRPKVRHHKPLDRSELPAFLSAVRNDGGERATAIALELLLLTFVRPGELAGARWAEVDMAGAMMKIDAARMKKGEDHYIPLSSQALALLRELHALTGHREHLFPNERDPRRSMDKGTLNRAITRIGYGEKISPHSMRATASTILNGMGFSPDWIEKQLAHAERNQSRAAYNQQQWLPERAKMMQTWADVVNSSAKVIPLRAGAMADAVSA